MGIYTNRYQRPIHPKRTPKTNAVIVVGYSPLPYVVPPLVDTFPETKSNTFRRYESTVLRVASHPSLERCSNRNPIPDVRQYHSRQCVFTPSYWYRLSFSEPTQMQYFQTASFTSVSNVKSRTGLSTQISPEPSSTFLLTQSVGLKQ